MLLIVQNFRESSGIMAVKHQRFETRQTMQNQTFEVFRYKDAYPKEVTLHHHDFYEIYFFVSGNVSYNGTLNTMDCNTVSANCTLVTGSAPSNLSMDSVSGDLILELPESCGFTADIDSMSGTISSEFETTASGNRHTYGNGNCRISADTMSGDIIIQKS
jgi:DUF4097 and DUF4098 domain-containing protein YvlB